MTGSAYGVVVVGGGPAEAVIVAVLMLAERAAELIAGRTGR